MSWDPHKYENFRDARHRPFQDLISRVPMRPQDVKSIVDAGCGTGRTARFMAGKFGNAKVTGIDNSKRMLKFAFPHKRLQYLLADLQEWQPDEPLDLVVANASLQWVPRPREVIKNMVGWIAPGGVMAMQVPANFDAPSHQLVRLLASHWQLDVAAGDNILELQEYVELYERLGFYVDAWQTTYLHDLEGDDAVLKWLSGTTLRPYLQALPKEKRPEFLADLKEPLLEAYPPQNGKVRYPFTRRFVVARRI